MKKTAKIYVAGHRGLVGSAICRELEKQGYKNIVKKTSKQLDLRNQKAVENFFKKEKPEYVFLAAAKVGGILANNIYRANFIYDNIQIQNNIIHNSYLFKVKKLLFLGSSCIYPKNCPQPIKEEYLLTDELEYTNEPYAIAKISGIKMCESYNIQYGTNFIAAMPTNLYGPNDNFDLEKSHVLPALIRKMHLAKLYKENNKNEIIKDLEVKNWQQAKKVLNKHKITRKNVTLWGSGKPRREFLYSDDLSGACIFIMKKVNFSDLSKNLKDIKNTHINIGSGIDLTIKELAEIIKMVVKYEGDLIWDKTKLDGTKQKLLKVAKINKLGWKQTTSLLDGIERVYKKY